MSSADEPAYVGSSGEEQPMDSEEGAQFVFSGDDSDGAGPSADDSMDDDYGGALGEPVMAARKAKPYHVLDEKRLRARQHEAVEAVTSVLSIPAGEAVRVLREFKWDVARVHEEWFADTDAVRARCGLVDAPAAPGPRPDPVRCGICFEDVPAADTLAARCGHAFCRDCWTGYVTAAVDAGPTALSLRCPLPKCGAAVPVAVIDAVATPALRERYSRYERRSYVDDNRRAAWCPAPGCEHAVETVGDAGVGGAALDVDCACGAAFCFSCKEEAHRPVDCETVHRWIVKNSAESENMTWILANTKQCPKCKRPIEKNQGCMHMTCSQCRHQFCWLCCGAWADHGERTGGFYSCNRYEAAKKKGDYDEEAATRERARTALERYMHYFQRWAEHDRARARAVAAAASAVADKLDRLAEVTGTPTSQLRFIGDAWAQVIQCRRILKWTYAYGYYQFAERGTTGAENGGGPAAPSSAGAAAAARADGAAAAAAASEAALKQQQEFFEFAQGQAENYLEKLHAAVEKRLDAMLDAADAAEAAAAAAARGGRGASGSGSGDESDDGLAAAAAAGRAVVGSVPAGFGGAGPHGGAAAGGASSYAPGGGGGGAGAALMAAAHARAGPPLTPPAEWAQFREQLIGLTDVTRTHFDKLVAELERGLDDLASAYATGPSGGGGPGGGAGPSSQQLSAGAGAGAGAAAAATQGWVCGACTYNNAPAAGECAMCEHPRGG